jgi:hypothetical protein
MTLGHRFAGKQKAVALGQILFLLMRRRETPQPFYFSRPAMDASKPPGTSGATRRLNGKDLQRMGVAGLRVEFATGKPTAHAPGATRCAGAPGGMGLWVS